MTDVRMPIPAKAASLRDKLFAPVAIAPLVWFRVAFGLVLHWEAWRYFYRGTIAADYLDPSFRFTYYGFEWLKPWPGDGMYWHFFALGALALFIAAGFLYRLSTTLFFLGFAYVFLLDETHYLNHFYLVSLLSFLLIFVPAHRACSLDARIWPKIRTRWAPLWSLWLLRGQVIIVYFYAAVAKMNPDWLFRGEPLRTWFAAKTYFPLVGPYIPQGTAAHAAAIGGFLIDLLAVPLILLSRRARPFAFAALFGFHLMNSILFRIGIFPWLMIAVMFTLFPLPFGWKLPGETAPPSEPAPPVPRHASVVIAFLAVYMAIQVLVPLRHWLYPGDVAWTREGHRFAWRMMLVGTVTIPQFRVRDPATLEERDIQLSQYLTPRQITTIGRQPDMILQFAKHLARLAAQQGTPDLEVYAQTLISVNGRPMRLLVNPNIDLVKKPRDLLPARWIVSD